MSLGITKKAGVKNVDRSSETIVIDRPIFITGLGRSGTTIIHTMLSTHPRVNWLSLLAARFPQKPYLNRHLMTALDLPILGNVLRQRFVPLENYAFWDSCVRGFSAPCRDLVGEDVDVRSQKKVRSVLGKLLTKKRNRLLIKITGVPRIAFLHRIFPDAKFVHVTRDGRDVANSRMKTSFWRGWQGLNASTTMPAMYREEWQHHQYSFVALAGIEWKLHCDQFEIAKRSCPAISIHEMSYEAFCAEPVEELQRVARHCELEWSPAFEDRLRRQYVKSENGKWKVDLTTSQQAVLCDVLQTHLFKYGYEEASTPAFAPRSIA